MTSRFSRSLAFAALGAALVVGVGGFRTSAQDKKTGAPKFRGFVPGRWIVERTHAHLGVFRAIRTRWSRRLDSFEAFLAIGAAHYIVRAIGL